MRPLRLSVSLAAVVAGSVLIGALPAWAPTVGQPPAPGYPACTKVGDDGNDTIRGTRKRDVICADEGNDLVFAKAGKDWLFGGNGKDRFHGGSGADTFHTWAGNDRLFGDEGNDRLNGELGNDTIVGGPGKDEFIGSSGNDCFYAVDGEGGDVLKGMKGRDHYEADKGDIIQGSTEGPANCYGPA